MKIIDIYSKRHGHVQVKVSDSDYEMLRSKRWHVNRCGNKLYAIKSQPPQLKMHNVIMGDKMIDHKDGDTLNNQRENLRKCSKSENLMNSMIRSDNTTGFKGIEVAKPQRNLKKPYRVRLNAFKKRIHGGYFATKEEAAARYNELALIYHGEFAKPNVL